MRLFSLIMVLLLGLSLVPAQASAAGTPEPQVSSEKQIDDSVQKFRAQAHDWLTQSRELLGSAVTEAQKATGLSQDQLYGVGVGAVAGLIVADLIGTGGIGTVAVVGAGGLFGNWVATK